MAMRFHWIQDRVKDGQFQVFWEPGVDNKADYFSNHHTAKHHKIKRYEYLCDEAQANHIIMRGCVDVNLNQQLFKANQIIL